MGFVIWEWLIFVGVMALGQFSPGPDMVLLTRVALAEGRRAGWATAFGIACGLGIHSAVALFGVGVLLAQGGVISEVMRWLAFGYLVWLGWQLMVSSWQGGGVDFGDDPVGGERLGVYWRRGFFCNVLNPKVVVFLGGVVVPFLGEDRGWEWAGILWGTIVFEGLILWCLWASVLQVGGVRGIYRRCSRWIDGVFGVMLWGMAVFLVVS